MRNRMAILSAALLTVAAGPVAAAVVSLQATVTGTATGGCFSGDQLDNFPTTAVFVSCGGGSDVEGMVTRGASSAVGADGRIGVAVGSSSIASGPIFQGFSSVESMASARVVDGVFFSIMSGFFEIPIDILGSSFLSVSQGEGAGFDSYSGLRVSVEVSAFNETRIAYALDGRRDIVGDEFVTILEEFGSTGIYNHRIPIIGGVASFSVGLFATATCGVAGNDPGSTCNSAANFANSARFLAASVFDENGNLSNGSLIGSESGFDYLVGVEPHIPPVPLPAAVHFIVLGLISLFGVKRWGGHLDPKRRLTV